MKFLKIKIIIAVLVSIGCIILIIYNLLYNGDFFKIPLYALVNIIIAVLFAYYLTQLKNDERKKKRVHIKNFKRTFGYY